MENDDKRKSALELKEKKRENRKHISSLLFSTLRRNMLKLANILNVFLCLSKHTHINEIVRDRFIKYRCFD